MAWDFLIRYVDVRHVGEPEWLDKGGCKAWKAWKA
jgi:hypothetical protein